MRTDTLALENSRTFEKHDLVNIYEQYNPGLYRYAYRLLGDQALAEDCVAETFSRFLQAIRGGRGPTENVQAYLYRVAHNWITDLYRRKTPITEPLEFETIPDPGASPLAQMTERQTRERVREALMQLSAEHRQVIVFRFVEDRSHEEIAALMGKTVEASRAMQHRAVTVLRTLLLGIEDE